MTSRKTVLFVCVGNAGRSVMAEAIFNKSRPEGRLALSAGVVPARATNPQTGPSLSELGIPLPPHSPQRLTQPMALEAT